MFPRSEVEHRLEVKKINGLTFIDDAFNSNPVGSKMAVDVLSLMSGKKSHSYPRHD